MFKKLFHKQNTDFNIYSPVNGTSYDITKTPDEVFAQKMLGDGFSTSPTDGNIYSPIVGTIVSLFPTKHAVGIESDNGVQVLVHMGINTVELKGIPFDIYVEEGDKVNSSTKIATVDLDYLKNKNIKDDIVVVFTNMDKVKKININSYGTTSASDQIGSYQVNK
ncbi:PTS glucose transporter subunit IIA [Companilactobacillus sp. FL22-1]|uniref:PTS sugar transporter subunit IIA n=1 Tax=Companilactobacillus sp. FL22-1 TaxID=3373892 RepID=UPI00375436EF